MDELLIEDKKYVSSKRAAKMTGYAKDYVGQLCREGRVPARLVGRGWYVLESAIQDHRFGDSTATKTSSAKAIETPIAYESPRYEAADAEVFPPVNRLREKEQNHPTDDTDMAAQRLQDTWQAWFDRFDHAAPISTSITNDAIEESPEVADMAVPIEIKKEEKEPDAVPIRAIHQTPYQPVQRAVLPQEEGDEGGGEEDSYEIKTYEPAIASKPETTTTARAIQMSGVLVAAIIFIAAALGSGYFDTYINSNNNRGIGLFAGVSFYNR
ncbi:MAG: helix-turn-helix domain-containing protein [Patescibacteria group bacterium]|nr:helix-turn-helix domain-containing protein [Patescibacteria group bacterium]